MQGRAPRRNTISALALTARGFMRSPTLSSISEMHAHLTFPDSSNGTPCATAAVSDRGSAVHVTSLLCCPTDIATEFGALGRTNQRKDILREMISGSQ